jgi:hypothetical protein
MTVWSYITFNENPHVLIIYILSSPKGKKKKMQSFIFIFFIFAYTVQSVIKQMF